MKTIIPLEDFSGYPSGAKEGSKRQDFTKGEEASVPDTFADLVVGKGHAREAAPEAKALAAEKETAKSASKKAE